MSDSRKKAQLNPSYRVSAAADSAQEALDSALDAFRGAIKDLHQEDAEQRAEGFYPEEQFRTVLEVGLLQISTREALQSIEGADKVDALSDLLFDDDSLLMKNLPREVDFKDSDKALKIVGTLSIIFTLLSLWVHMVLSLMNFVAFLVLYRASKSIRSESKKLLEERNSQEMVIPPEVEDFATLSLEIQERLKRIEGLMMRATKKEELQRETASLIRQARNKIVENKKLFQMNNAVYQRLQEGKIESIQTGSRSRIEDEADEQSNEEQLAEAAADAELEAEAEAELNDKPTLSVGKQE